MFHAQVVRLQWENRELLAVVETVPAPLQPELVVETETARWSHLSLVSQSPGLPTASSHSLAAGRAGQLCSFCCPAHTHTGPAHTGPANLWSKPVSRT